MTRPEANGTTATVDFYKELGVQYGSSDASIKASYRRLARKYHPDKNPGDSKSATAKFQRLQSAFETLSDPAKRRQYNENYEQQRRDAKRKEEQRREREKRQNQAGQQAAGFQEFQWATASPTAFYTRFSHAYHFPQRRPTATHNPDLHRQPQQPHANTASGSTRHASGSSNRGGSGPQRNESKKEAAGRAYEDPGYKSYTDGFTSRGKADPPPSSTQHQKTGPEAAGCWAYEPKTRGTKENPENVYDSDDDFEDATQRFAEADQRARAYWKKAAREQRQRAREARQAKHEPQGVRETVWSSHTEDHTNIPPRQGTNYSDYSQHGYNDFFGSYTSPIPPQTPYQPQAFSYSSGSGTGFSTPFVRVISTNGAAFTSFSSANGQNMRIQTATNGSSSINISVGGSSGFPSFTSNSCRFCSHRGPCALHALG